MVFLPLTTRPRGSSGECGFASQVTVWHSTAVRYTQCYGRLGVLSPALRLECLTDCPRVWAGHLLTDNSAGGLVVS